MLAQSASFRYDILEVELDDHPPIVLPHNVQFEERRIEDEVPEGGVAGWSAVLGGSFLLFISQGAIQAFGVYQDFYTRVFLSKYTPSQISWIGSVQLFLVLIVGLPAGKMFDEGYFNRIVLFGSCLYIISYFLLSVAQPQRYYQVFLSQGLGVGLAMGCLYGPSFSLAFQYFKARKALAIGIISSGSALGGILQTIGLNRLINGNIGFAWAVRIFGFIFLALVITANLIMRPRLPGRQHQDHGQPPLSVKNVLKNVPFNVWILGQCMALWGLFFPLFYIQLYAVLHNVSPNLAFYLIAVLNVASLFGRIISGIVADRFGHINILIPASFIAAITLFTMDKAVSSAGLVVFALIYGFFSGACLSLGVSGVSVFIEDPSQYGILMGASFFFESFFVLVANPISAALLQTPNYLWSRAIHLSAIIFLIGDLFAFSALVLLRKKKKVWRLFRTSRSQAPRQTRG